MSSSSGEKRKAFGAYYMRFDFAKEIEHELFSGEAFHVLSHEAKLILTDLKKVEKHVSEKQPERMASFLNSIGEDNRHRQVTELCASGLGDLVGSRQATQAARQKLQSGEGSARGAQKQAQQQQEEEHDMSENEYWTRLYQLEFVRRQAQVFGPRLTIKDYDPGFSPTTIEVHRFVFRGFNRVLVEQKKAPLKAEVHANTSWYDAGTEASAVKGFDGNNALFIITSHVDSNWPEIEDFREAIGNEKLLKDKVRREYNRVADVGTPPEDATIMQIPDKEAFRDSVLYIRKS